jgi:hypothetical protein
MNMVMEENKRPDQNSGKEMTPGGFHSLEYRWALKEAFEFMEAIGKERVCRAQPPVQGRAGRHAARALAYRYARTRYWGFVARI